MYFIFLFGYLLAIVQPACAGPPASDVPSSIVLEPNLNNSLAYPPPPAGPSEFAIQVSHSTTRFLWNKLLISTVHLAGQLALGDWTDPMSQARSTYRDPSYPQLVIAIASAGSTPLQRRFVLWGLARFTDHMVRHNQFVACQAQLFWRGSPIGSIRFIHLGGPRARSIDGSENVNETAEMVARSDENNNELSWDYTFYDRKLEPIDIYMGSIAALVQVAERPKDNIDSFVGSWPQGYFRCIQWWLSEPRGQPSVFSKADLVKSMIEAVDEGVARKDTRQVKIVVKRGARDIAKGALVKTFPVSGEMDEMYKSDDVTA
ncbi:MAG: hypothetical protein Q9213_005540 [Squamulea squamosa]